MESYYIQKAGKVQYERMQLICAYMVGLDWSHINSYVAWILCFLSIKHMYANTSQQLPFRLQRNANAVFNYVTIQ